MTTLEKSQLALILSQYKDDRILFLIFTAIFFLIAILGHVSDIKSPFDEISIPTLCCAGAVFCLLLFIKEIINSSRYHKKLEQYDKEGLSVDDALKLFFSEKK